MTSVVEAVAEEAEKLGVQVPDPGQTVKWFLLGYTLGRQWPIDVADRPRLARLVGMFFGPRG